MKELIEIQRKLLPDLLDVMHKRYKVLLHVRLLQPIGRRALASQLEISERVLRGEVDFLKDQQLLNIASNGMSLTNSGQSLLLQLEDVMKETLGLVELENRLKERLEIDEVVVVAGDSDNSELVKLEMGRASVSKLMSCLNAKNIIAVTGGTTIASVAEMMTPLPKGKQALFVPARGGLGENVENQANSICAKMAKRARGEYKLLHVPDQINQQAYEHMIQEPAVKEILHMIQSPTTVIHGIGDAITMAERRKTPLENLKEIKEGQAVGEAFGYYFDKDGKVVFKVNTIGLQLQDINETPCVISVAGGVSKAKAIAAFTKKEKNITLITDEGAARALLEDNFNL